MAHLQHPRPDDDDGEELEHDFLQDFEEDVDTNMSDPVAASGDSSSSKRNKRAKTEQRYCVYRFLNPDCLGRPSNRSKKCQNCINRGTAWGRFCNNRPLAVPRWRCAISDSEIDVPECPVRVYPVTVRRVYMNMPAVEQAPVYLNVLGHGVPEFPQPFAAAVAATPRYRLPEFVVLSPKKMPSKKNPKSAELYPFFEIVAQDDRYQAVPLPVDTEGMYYLGQDIGPVSPFSGTAPPSPAHAQSSAFATVPEAINAFSTPAGPLRSGPATSLSGSGNASTLFSTMPAMAAATPVQPVMAMLTDFESPTVQIASTSSAARKHKVEPAQQAQIPPSRPSPLSSTFASVAHDSSSFYPMATSQNYDSRTVGVLLSSEEQQPLQPPHTTSTSTRSSSASQLEARSNSPSALSIDHEMKFEVGPSQTVGITSPVLQSGPRYVAVLSPVYWNVSKQASPPWLHIDLSRSPAFLDERSSVSVRTEFLMTPHPAQFNPIQHRSSLQIFALCVPHPDFEKPGVKELLPHIQGSMTTSRLVKPARIIVQVHNVDAIVLDFQYVCGRDDAPDAATVSAANSGARASDGSTHGFWVSGTEEMWAMQFQVIFFGQVFSYRTQAIMMFLSGKLGGERPQLLAAFFTSVKTVDVRPFLRLAQHVLHSPGTTHSPRTAEQRESLQIMRDILSELKTRFPGEIDEERASLADDVNGTRSAAASLVEAPEHFSPASAGARDVGLRGASQDDKQSDTPGLPPRSLPKEAVEPASPRSAYSFAPLELKEQACDLEPVEMKSIVEAPPVVPPVPVFQSLASLDLALDGKEEQPPQREQSAGSVSAAPLVAAHHIYSSSGTFSADKTTRPSSVVGYPNDRDDPTQPQRVSSEQALRGVQHVRRALAHQFFSREGIRDLTTFDVGSFVMTLAALWLPFLFPQLRKLHQREKSFLAVAAAMSFVVYPFILATVLFGAISGMVSNTRDDETGNIFLWELIFPLVYYLFFSVSAAMYMSINDHGSLSLVLRLFNRHVTLTGTRFPMKTDDIQAYDGAIRTVEEKLARQVLAVPTSEVLHQKQILRLILGQLTIQRDLLHRQTQQGEGQLFEPSVDEGRLLLPRELADLLRSVTCDEDASVEAFTNHFKNFREGRQISGDWNWCHSRRFDLKYALRALPATLLHAAVHMLFRLYHGEAVLGGESHAVRFVSIGSAVGSALTMGWMFFFLAAIVDMYRHRCDLFHNFNAHTIANERQVRRWQGELLQHTHLAADALPPVHRQLQVFPSRERWGAHSQLMFWFKIRRYLQIMQPRLTRSLQIICGFCACIMVLYVAVIFSCVFVAVEQRNLLALLIVDSVLLFFWVMRVVDAGARLSLVQHKHLDMLASYEFHLLDENMSGLKDTRETVQRLSQHLSAGDVRPAIFGVVLDNQLWLWYNFIGAVAGVVLATVFRESYII